MAPDLRFWGKGVWGVRHLENDEGNYVIRGNPEVSAGMRERSVYLRQHFQISESFSALRTRQREDRRGGSPAGPSGSSPRNEGQRHQKSVP